MKKLKTEFIQRQFKDLLDDKSKSSILRQKLRKETMSTGSLKRSYLGGSERFKNNKIANLTKEEIAYIKQKEREQYYRANVRK